MNPSKSALLLAVSAVAALSLTAPVMAQDQKEHGGHEARPAMSESEGTRSQSDSGDQEGRGGSESRDTLREGPDSHNSSEESDRQDHELGRAEEDRRGDRETFEAKQHQGDASRDGHDRRDVSMFFSDLQGHGSWLKRGDFDYVFVPQVESGWRPYVRGHWVWTDEYGWYWASNEPFAWAVYHYGRWGYDPDIGWFWVPGNVWAPAWVTWRRGGGHVGWAPIAPRGRGYALGYADYYEPPIVEAWVFVPEKRFVAVDIVSYVEPVVEVNTILRESRETFHLERRGDVVVNEFLPRRQVAKIVDTEIKEYKVKDAREPFRQSESGDTIEVFRPDLADAKPKEAPAKVVERPDELKSKPKLSETAKGERPEGAPPSAAELKPSEGSEGTPAKAERDKAEQQGKPEGKSAEEPGGEPKGKGAEEQGKPERSKAEQQGKPEGKSAEERGGEPKGKGAEEQAKPERSKAEQQGKPEGKSAEERGGEPKGKGAEEQAKPERSKAEQQGKPEGKSAEERGG